MINKILHNLQHQLGDESPLKSTVYIGIDRGLLITVLLFAK